MKKAAIVALVAAATTALALAAPAQAYDRDAYAYAASHMLGNKQVVAPLTAKPDGFFTAGPDSKSWLCQANGRDVNYPGGLYRFSINYPSAKKNQSGVNAQVEQFASATKAIAAFNALKKGAKECSGPTSGSSNYPDADGNTVTDTWSSLTTTGVVPLVTIVGVPSVFINTNYQDVSSDQDSPYTSDNYTVYTLVNDVIISTNYYSGSELNISGAERKAVNQTAFNAVSAWLG